MNKQPTSNHLLTPFLLYTTEDGQIRIETRLQDDTLWLTQEQMAALFGKSKSTINEHIKNIFKENELIEGQVMQKFGISEFQRKAPNYYNLEMIIALGYRVKSLQGRQFRIWATTRLKEYLVKGFIMDDERLKNPDNTRYFEELLARIRDIRSSEKVFWRKVLDIYATSIDYDPKSNTSQLFFKSIQNKMHWAAHGHTAVELIYQRADAKQDNMGITSHAGNRIIKRDVEVAKNYLSEEELNILNRIVTAYLEMAELQALNHSPMKMQDWIERLDMFLTMTGRELLTHVGKISHTAALHKAHEEYDKFRQQIQQEPTTVEQHFIEAEQKMKQITAIQKNLGKA